MAPSIYNPPPKSSAMLLNIFPPVIMHTPPPSLDNAPPLFVECEFLIIQLFKVTFPVFLTDAPYWPILLLNITLVNVVVLYPPPYAASLLYINELSNAIVLDLDQIVPPLFSLNLYYFAILNNYQ